jgi:chromosome transmission fidelity protein 1
MVWQVIFCSRTHSQLSQFVGELKRTAFAKDLRVVALGSRRQLCVHPAVQSLKSAARMNERCLELQDGGGQSKLKKTDQQQPPKGAKGGGGGKARKPPNKGCPYLKKKGSDMHKLKEAILAEPMDIEEIGQQAR